MERDTLLFMLDRKPSDLKNYPEYQDDTDFIREAVQKNGWILCFASERLRGDYETVMLALQNEGLAYRDISEEMKHRRDVVLAAVSEDGMVYQQIPKEYKADREIALAAVLADGAVLGLVPAAYREEREFVLAAVTRYCSGFAVDSLLPFIPRRFLSDKEIVIHLVAIEGYFYQDADPKFARDIDVLEEVVKHNSYLFEEFDEDIRGNKEYAKRFLSHEVTLWCDLSEELQHDKELAMQVMHHPECRYALPLFPPELQSDRDVLRAYAANFEDGYRRAYAFDENIAKVTIPEDLFAEDTFMQDLLNIYFDQEDQLDNDTVMGGNKTFILRALEMGRDVSRLIDLSLLEDADVRVAMERQAKQAAARQKREARKAKFLNWFKRNKQE